MDESTEVIEVAGEPLHTVHNDGVPVAGGAQQFRELSLGGVPCGGFVREDPAQNLAIELAFLVLVERAHLPDPLFHPFACEVDF